MKIDLTCRVCGDMPDRDNPGLGRLDDGHPGGMGGCGDLHSFRRLIFTGWAIGYR